MATENPTTINHAVLSARAEELMLVLENHLSRIPTTPEAGDAVTTGHLAHRLAQELFELVEQSDTAIS